MQKAGQLHSYWKRSKAKECICDQCTINFGLKCGTSKDESNELLTIAQCISRRSKARKEYNDLMKDQAKNRDDFLTKRAEE